MTHKIKIWPHFFDLVKSGEKPFEVRKNDRDYQRGDIVILQEWNPVSGTYTGRELKRAIGYVFYPGVHNLSLGYCDACIFTLIYLADKPEAPEDPNGVPGEL